MDSPNYDCCLITIDSYLYFIVDYLKISERKLVNHSLIHSSKINSEMFASSFGQMLTLLAM